MPYQNFVCYRLNPNKIEFGDEDALNKDMDGKIFSSCTLEIEDHVALLKDENDVIKAVLSLHHFYLLNYNN